MSIVTKNGDSGKTSLFSGEKVFKDDPRVQAYGTLDELNSWIGECKNYLSDPRQKENLLEIQKTLFRCMGQLATKKGTYPQPITNKDVDNITELVYSLEKNLHLKGFVIPGGNTVSAKLDICRTVARRAERRIISLSRQENIAPELLSYVNRLSDFLFVLARTEDNQS
ncbi:MAG TPA: cob(I)yrinic acid a,c-diamide adenosyltransferase [Candidatus Cloacimonas sp.]|jgi:ATP:cob(I)alamin adenosyltransferase|nr:cob(I)yrinic acid a,c-diamide adenosyltransferase [Candidatus Cloacimonas sp.]